MTDELRQANHKLEVLSLTDDLTGLANMRCFNQRYLELLEDCRKGSFGAGIIMLDIDH
jgi:PleD family two-component response regulator